MELAEKSEKTAAEVTTLGQDPVEPASRGDESVTEDAPEFEEEEGAKAEPKESSGGAEAKPAVGEAGKVVAAKAVYTPEELEALLQSEGDVDTSRLSPEGKALMKSFQRGLDRKFQQVAEMKKSIAAQGPKTPREELFDRYVKDPGGVVGEINAEIEKMESVDPTDERYTEARRTVARLQALKDDFSVRRQDVIEHGRQVDSIVATTQAEILKEIPDFKEKADKLTEFAVGAGLSIQEVRALTDPTIVGPMALKLTRVINHLYDKLHAPVSAEKKVKRDAPPPLQRGGASGALDKKGEDDPGKLSMSEYLKKRKSFAE